MDKDKSHRVAKRPLRWMVVFLIALPLAALAMVVVFQLQPESLVNPPSEPKPLTGSTP